MPFHNTSAGSHKIGGATYELTRVTHTDPDYDLGEVHLPTWTVFPEYRNRVINDWDEAKRKAWLEEVAREKEPYS